LITPRHYAAICHCWFSADTPLRHLRAMMIIVAYAAIISPLIIFTTPPRFSLRRHYYASFRRHCHCFR